MWTSRVVRHNCGKLHEAGESDWVVICSPSAWLKLLSAQSAIHLLHNRVPPVSNSARFLWLNWPMSARFRWCWSTSAQIAWFRLDVAWHTSIYFGIDRWVRCELVRNSSIVEFSDFTVLYRWTISAQIILHAMHASALLSKKKTKFRWIQLFCATI